jgi:hypothetical protein
MPSLTQHINRGSWAAFFLFLGGCAAPSKISAIVLDENLATVALVPGPPSKAMTGILSEASFAILSQTNLVRIMSEDGIFTDNQWVIPNDETPMGFASDGAYLVAIRDTSLVWRRTIDGALVGEVRRQVPQVYTWSRNAGFFAVDTNTLEMPSETFSSTARGGGRWLIDLSKDKTTFSRIRASGDHYPAFDIYRNDGALLSTLQPLAWSVAWIGDADFAMLGPQGYCEWTHANGVNCPWSRATEMTHISKDICDDTVLLWSPATSYLIRYMRNDGRELALFSVPEVYTPVDVGLTHRRIAVALIFD